MNATQTDTRPPVTIYANLDAEAGVMGSLLIDPTAIAKVKDVLKPADFFREQHQSIYAAMLDLHARGVEFDLITLLDELHSDEEPRLAAYLTETIQATPTSLNVLHYANIVRDGAMRRAIILAAGNLATLAYDPDRDIRESLETHLGALKKVQLTSRAASRPVGRAVSKTITRICDILDGKVAPPGIMTGYTMLDRLMGGLRNADLLILGARPGMGKTSLALGIASYAAHHGKHVMIMSLEMSEEQLVDRLLAMHTDIDSTRIRDGKLHAAEEMPLVMAAANAITNLPISIISPDLDEDEHGHYVEKELSVNSLRAEVLALKEQGNPVDLVIVDYLQLLARPSSYARRNANTNDIITEISRALKQLAMELKIPVLALSQLSRAVEQRSDKRPQLSDLRDSGSIEQDADVVIFMYRDDYYNENSTTPNITEITVAKGRNIPKGTISLFFRQELTRFQNLEIVRTELDY